MSYPYTRLRRLRKKNLTRSMIQENRVNTRDLILPLFACDGIGIKEPISSLQGSFNMSPDVIAKEALEVYNLGIPAILLFAKSRIRDSVGSDAYTEDSVACQAIKAIKKHVPELVIITDVCLCGYTNHGHCGVIENNEVINDKTSHLLAKIAVAHAKAGADIVAPSDMMDGRVIKIRTSLDEAGFENVAIMSYSAKYASAYYGPFRDASGSAPLFGNRKSYQMNPANSEEAMSQIKLDIEQGADIVMIKPATNYLDIINRAKSEFHTPIAAYHVSGEYMMVVSAAQNGLLNLDEAMNEALISIKRAGAKMIITYYAKEFARKTKTSD